MLKADVTRSDALALKLVVIGSTIDCDGSEIDGPDLNAVTFESLKPMRAEKSRRHEKDVPVLLGPASHFGHIKREFLVVCGVNCRKGFRANHAVDTTHDIQRSRRVCSGRQVVAAGVWMERQQLPSCC